MIVTRRRLRWARHHGRGAARRGPEHSFGLNSPLPFEQAPKRTIEGDKKR